MTVSNVMKDWVTSRVNMWTTLDRYYSTTGRADRTLHLSNIQYTIYSSVKYIKYSTVKYTIHFFEKVFHKRFCDKHVCLYTVITRYNEHQYNEFSSKPRYNERVRKSRFLYGLISLNPDINETDITKEYRRKVDAATRCSGVCPHTRPDLI